jgi:large subunit ribosomal protein L15
MPLQRRLPKRGFHNPFRREFSIVNLGQLQECFEAGAIVDRDALRQHGLLRHKSLPIKVLAKGELTKAMTVKADQFSGTARQRLEAVGGTAEVTGA